MTCKIEKLISDFPINKRMRDGRLNRCKTCEYARVKEWRESNPDRVKYLITKWRAENPEQFKDHLRRHYQKNVVRIGLVRSARYEKNKEKVLAQCKEYQRNNPAYRNKKNATRRAAYVLALPRWLTSIQQAQIDEFYEIARAKTMQIGNRYHVDHIIPLRGKTACGLHVPWNLQVLEGRENNRKFNKVMEI
jgi:SepF-like predicted cell division protein (DUF552 family)